MAIQVTTSGFDDTLGVLKDPAFLATAFRHRDGSERAHLNWLMRTYGIANIGSPELRHDALLLLARNSAVSDLDRTVLSRLVNAGTKQPTFDQYIAPPGLNLSEDLKQHGSVEEIANYGLARTEELLSALLELEQLKNRSDYLTVEANVQRVIGQCGALRFGHEGDARALISENYGDVLRHSTLLPQSDEPLEILFMAVNSVGAVLFDTAATLIERAITRVVHENAMLASMEIHYAGLVLKPLIPANRCLNSMNVDTWLYIREYIDKPSAIQSNDYRRLVMALNELNRVADHARFPRHEASRAPILQAVLSETESQLFLWQKQHLAIADKYTPGGSGGLTWLEQQVERTRQERSAREASSQKSLDTDPAGKGGCPFGY